MCCMCGVACNMLLSVFFIGMIRFMSDLKGSLFRPHMVLLSYAFLLCIFYISNLFITIHL